MARAVEQIERDIAALEKSVEAIAQEFYTTYNDYLIALGQTVRQQLVLVAYYVCTQGYPDRFLKLSLNQRQELQQALRQLGKQAQTQLIDQLKSASSSAKPDPDDFSSESEESDEDDSDEEGSYVFFEAEEGFLPDDSPAESLSSSDLPSSVYDQADNNTSESSTISEVSEDANEDTDDSNKNTQEQPLSNPQKLMSWQANLEKLILRVLLTLSHAANRLLQQSDILPNKLPEPILEVAAKAGAEAIARHPNLLNLLIETNANSADDSTVTHVMAIRMRLSEIEFNDSILTAWRSKIRGLLTRLNHLGREYQKKQREKAIAQAEAAWRSSWFED